MRLRIIRISEGEYIVQSGCVYPLTGDLLYNNGTPFSCLEQANKHMDSVLASLRVDAETPEVIREEEV